MTTDIVIPTQAFHKIRARVIRCDNAGLTLAEKSVSIFVAAHASNEAGTDIAPVPTAEIEVPVPVLDLLADPETAADAAAALAALERIGALYCQRYAAQLAAKLAPPVKEPTND
jgi:hypothetical protein